jgi:peptidoglycan hydrolase-like protein with peptidoglycan-binding domain
MLHTVSSSMRRALISVGMATAVTASIVLMPIASTPAYAATPMCNTDYRRPTSIYNVRATLPAYSTPSVYITTTCLLRRVYNSVPNDAVIALQDTLNSCFALSEVLEEDGVFGGRTQAMLKQAQGIVGTAQDGVYGPHTRDSFNYYWKWVAYNMYDGRRYCEQVSGL